MQKIENAHMPRSNLCSCPLKTTHQLMTFAEVVLNTLTLFDTPQRITIHIEKNKCSEILAPNSSRLVEPQIQDFQRLSNTQSEPATSANLDFSTCSKTTNTDRKVTTASAQKIRQVDAAQNVTCKPCMMYTVYIANVWTLPTKFGSIGADWRATHKCCL